MKAQVLGRRRRGRRFKIAVYALGGLAAACAAVMAYRVQWNPLPLLGVMMGTGALYYFGPRSFDHVKKLFHAVPQTAEEFGRYNFQASDPVAERLPTYLGQPDTPYYYEERFLEKMGEMRRYFVPLNGSDKDGTYNRVNPVTLPEWIRLAMLPDLVGLNIGGQRCWQLWPDVEGLYEGGQKGVYTSPGATFVYLPMGEAPDLLRWEKVYPKIKALMGVEYFLRYDEKRGAVLMTVAGYDSPVGTFDQALPVEVADVSAGADMLPYEPLPFVQEQAPHGHLHDGWLYFGEQFLDKQAGPHWLKIDDLTHFLVMGTSGFGKSVFLNQMLQGVRANLHRFEKVLLVDLKGGVELWPYQRLGEQFRVVYRFDDLHEHIAGLVIAIEARLEQMREQGLRNWTGPKSLLVIDEYAQIQLSPEGSKEERQRKQELLANLNKISMLGRAAGVLIWAQLQKGTTDVMDSSFRANLASQVCFKVPNKLTAAGMFGSTDELAVDPVKLQKGRFILFDASKGETYYLQARVLQQ